MPFTTCRGQRVQLVYFYVTATKYMPPWTPDPAYSTLRERFLTEAEIELLADWHEAGARGDPADNPGLPISRKANRVDLTLTMEEAYVHNGDMLDQYQVFVGDGVSEETEIEQ